MFSFLKNTLKKLFIFLAMIDGGIGETQVNIFLSTLSVPTVLTSTLKKYERRVGVAVEAVAKESCEEAVRIEKNLSLENPDIME